MKDMIYERQLALWSIVVPYNGWRARARMRKNPPVPRFLVLSLVAGCAVAFAQTPSLKNDYSKAETWLCLQGIPPMPAAKPNSIEMRKRRHRTSRGMSGSRGA